jgi:hypothetical protein
MAVGTSKADLRERVNYLRSPSVTKGLEEQGALDHVVTRLIQDLQAAGEDIPAHVMDLRSPTVIKALATVDLLKSAGGGRHDPEEEKPVAPKTAQADGRPGAQSRSDMDAGAKSDDLRPDKGAGSGGQKAGPAVASSKTQPKGRLATYDRVKGFGLYENPSGDDIFGAVEQWEESGDYPVHFGKALVDLVDGQDQGGGDDEGGTTVIGLKSGAEWAGFAACGEANGGYTVQYLETAPSHRGAEAAQAGAGSRLLAAVFEKAAGQRVTVNALTETAQYFTKVGAKNIGGTAFVFDKAAQDKFLQALEADAKGTVTQPQKAFQGLTKQVVKGTSLEKAHAMAPSGYEQRKQAKVQPQQGALTAQTIYEAERALPHGLLIGPIHEAAGARVQRYYNPGTGENGVQKSLHIIYPKDLKE